MSVLLFIAGGAATGLLFGSIAAKGRRASKGSGDGEFEPRAETSREPLPALKCEAEAEAKPFPPLPAEVVPPKPLGVPFAEGFGRPVWPLRTSHPRRGVVSYRGIDGKVRGRWGRRFAAPREGTKGKRDRNHAGIDLFANPGDAVLAVAEGVVVAVQSFHLGSWAVFVDHGQSVVMYGEVDKRSWSRVGVSVGACVKAGQPIAEVACMVRNDGGGCTSHMLHVETYTKGTTQNQRWYEGDEAPPALRDPSLLLLHAAQEPSTPSVA